MVRSRGPDRTDASRQTDRTARSTNRREFLRRTVATAGVTGLASTAGCFGRLRPTSATADGSVVTADSESLSAAELDRYVAEMHERYGENGVWGTAGKQFEHGLSYRGAWTKRVRLFRDGKRSGGDEAAIATSDNALVLFEIPDKVDENGKRHFAVWLWSGARPNDESSEEGLLGRSPVLRSLESGFSLDDRAQDALAYSPSRTFETSPVTVARPSPFEGIDDVPPPAGNRPRRSGTHPRRSGGGYAIAWTGKYDRFQSVAGVCETRWHPDTPLSLTWEVSITGGHSGLV